MNFSWTFGFRHSIALGGIITWSSIHTEFYDNSRVAFYPGSGMILSKAQVLSIVMGREGCGYLVLSFLIPKRHLLFVTLPTHAFPTASPQTGFFYRLNILFIRVDLRNLYSFSHPDNRPPATDRRRGARRIVVLAPPPPEPHEPLQGAVPPRPHPGALPDPCSRIFVDYPPQHPVFTASLKERAAPMQIFFRF